MFEMMLFHKNNDIVFNFLRKLQIICSHKTNFDKFTLLIMYNTSSSVTTPCLEELNTEREAPIALIDKSVFLRSCSSI